MRAPKLRNEALKLSDFAGLWDVERHIKAEGSADALFVGQAKWCPEGDGMRYREEGQLTIENQRPLHAEREYFWTPDLNVFFADGRFFHQVLTDGRESTHWCYPDTYTGLYDFARWPEFSVSWHVSGPRKAYQSVTTYRRL